MALEYFIVSDVEF